ncbi:MAG: hypothetical protein ACKO6B_18035 [Planctomycetia bacterium]
MPRLDPARCTLLRDEQLVGRYNAVNDVLDEAARELPRFADKEVVAEVRGELSRLADVMTKKRFFIGFIGPSQVGKSATVCNLLSVDEENAPTPQGSSGPTTSVPTRTVPKPPAPGAENSIALHYFSKAEFQERIRDICDLVKIRCDEDLRQIREAAQAKQQEQPHFKAADMEVLLKLIDAALAFPEVLEKDGRVEQGVWRDRRIYATHQNTPSKYTLLREVSIEFVTAAVSPEVEMIDLPGIDVDKGSDARLTLAFVRDLDGAFMFQQGQQVKSAAIAKLAEKMREFHGRTLGERIWMVVTRCDALNELQTQGPRDRDDQPTMFCHLAELMKQQGIKGSNVHFVGNEYYHQRLKEGLTETHPASETLANRYPTVLQFAADGRPVIPERCMRNEGQVAPWEQFVLNGGIPALRETMQTKVADSVRAQTCREITRRLVGVIDRLTAALQAAEQQSGMTVEEMMRAARWSGELDRLADEIGCESKYSQEAAAAIAVKLGEVIGNWGRPSRGGLAENHQHLAGMLAHAGLHEATDQTSKVVKLVRAEIEKRSQSQPPPQATGLPTPVEHWATVAASFLEPGKTADGQPFRGPIFDGIREDSNPVAEGGQQMGADDYLAVMRSKVGRVARVFVSRLVHEMQGHLHRLQQRYRAVGSDIDHIDADQREQYARYRTALDRLRP